MVWHIRPEESVLYGVVQAELETFLARAQARERPVPRFAIANASGGDGSDLGAFEV